MIVITDSGPLRYLIIIEQVHLLKSLYGSAVIPRGVVVELTREATPQQVRVWMDDLPEWVTVKSPQGQMPAFSSMLRSSLPFAEETILSS